MSAGRPEGVAHPALGVSKCRYWRLRAGWLLARTTSGGRFQIIVPAQLRVEEVARLL